MTTSTQYNQTDFEFLEPRDEQLYEHTGFDREGIRYEFANGTPIDLSHHEISQADQLYVDQGSVSMSDGPHGIGESGESNTDFLVEEGAEHPTTRYAKGFTIAAEQVDETAAQKRDALLEMISFENDARTLRGYNRADGTWVPGIFQYLDNNIPSERIFDCSTFTDSYTGTEENVIKYDAFNSIANRLMSVDSPMWGAMVGSQDALSHFSKVSDGSSDRSSYWDRINANQGSGVGVNRRLWLPDELQFSRVADSQEPFTASLVDPDTSQWNGLGPDEVWLLPPMEAVRANLWRLYESPTPVMFHNTKDLGTERFDYVHRFDLFYDPKGQHSNATDCVKLTNVSSLFT